MKAEQVKRAKKKARPAGANEEINSSDEEKVPFMQVLLIELEQLS